MEGRTISHYRISKLLGKGTMGAVYLAEDIRLKRSLALKVLCSDPQESKESLKRFRIEAEAIARLNHLNIATLYTVEEVDNQSLIAMEYIDGQCLKDLIPETGLSLDIFFEWFLPLAEALAHAHEKGVIHRDIKPANIMVTREGLPKILDFGIARIHGAKFDQAGGSLGDESLTRIGTVMGSPAYMSPEQAAGGKVDYRTDIFSFGILMYESPRRQKTLQGSVDTGGHYKHIEGRTGTDRGCQARHSLPARSYRRQSAPKRSAKEISNRTGSGQRPEECEGTP